MKRILVLGGSGFLGVNLIRHLKATEDCWIRSLDRKDPDFGRSVADESHGLDLRFIKAGEPLLKGFDEIYQFASDVGGIGYLAPKNDAFVLRNSCQVTLNVLEALTHQGCGRVFFPSSAAVYPDHSCVEDSAYPANPQSEYGWGKLFDERLYQAYARCFDLQVRIGRLHNTFGPHMPYDNGKESVPAALARKVALQPEHGGTLEIWGDGEAQRSFMWIEDAIEGILRLTRSDFEGPVNIGSAECVSINYLAQVIMMVAGKQCEVKYVPGPRGVAGRNSSNTLILDKLGWAPKTPLHVGIGKFYPWIKEQIDKNQRAG